MTSVKQAEHSLKHLEQELDEQLNTYRWNRSSMTNAQAAQYLASISVLISQTIDAHLTKMVAEGK